MTFEVMSARCSGGIFLIVERGARMSVGVSARAPEAQRWVAFQIII
jgi:hypothetical protein